MRESINCKEKLLKLAAVAYFPLYMCYKCALCAAYIRIAIYTYMDSGITEDQIFAIYFLYGYYCKSNIQTLLCLLITFLCFFISNITECGYNYWHSKLVSLTHCKDMYYTKKGEMLVFEVSFLLLLSVRI